MYIIQYVYLSLSVSGIGTGGIVGIIVAILVVLVGIVIVVIITLYLCASKRPQSSKGDKQVSI